MDVNATEGHRSSLVLEEDSFLETLSNFSLPVVHQTVETLTPRSQETSPPEYLLDILAPHGIKYEPEHEEECFRDFYPEVSINEGELRMSTQQASLKKEGDVDLDTDIDPISSLEEDMYHSDIPVNLHIPRAVVNSFISRFEGQMKAADVIRSLNCFIPIIRLQNPESFQVITSFDEINRRRKYEKNGRTGRYKTAVIPGNQLSTPINYKELESANNRIPSKLTGIISKRRGRPRKVVPEVPRMEEELLKGNEAKIRPESSKEFGTEEAAFQNHGNPLEEPNNCETGKDKEHPKSLRLRSRNVLGKKELTKGSGSSRSCEVCNKVFTRVAGLVYHRRQIHKLGKAVERKYSCTICNKAFLQRSHLVLHKRAHQLEQTLTGDIDDASGEAEKGACPGCDVCGKVFTRTTGLMYHRRQVHGLGEAMERKFECNLCSKRFLKKSHLIFHGQSHTGERLFPCRSCERSFGGTTARRLHELKFHAANASELSKEEIEKTGADGSLKSTPVSTRKATGESQRYSCSYCTKIFGRPSAKRIHERSHTGEKPFLCVVCGKAYKSSVALKEHEKTVHTHTLDLICQVCGAAFGRQMSLKYHMLSKHNGGNRKFKCEQEGCGRSFVQRAKLVRHLRIHSKGFHQCPSCNRGLASKEHLDRHNKLHELKKLKLSGVKGIVVPRNSATPRKKPPPKQRKERKTPAPIRKLQCSYCEKRFPYQNELDKHTKAIHTGEREYKCTEAGCRKAYISHYKLQNHLRSAHRHIIENNLLADVACDECGKVVQGAARLAIHKKCRHSGSKPESRTTLTSPPRIRSKAAVHIAAIQNNNVSNKVKVVSTSSVEVQQSRGSVPLRTQQSLPLPSARGCQPQKFPDPQAAHSSTRLPAAGITQHHHVSATQAVRQNMYGGLQQQEQIQFYTYTPIPTPTFPYSAAQNLTNTPHHFHQTQFEFQNGPNFWQAHQNPPTHRLQPAPVYQQSIPPPQSQPVAMDVLEEDYPSSDYSDLIQIPPQDSDFHQDSNYTDDNDNYSTSNNGVDEEYLPEPEEPETPVRRRGRPPKGSAPPKEKAAPRRRATTKGSKPRKPLAKKHLPCPVCGKVLGTNQHLRDHQKIHERAQNKQTEEYKCDICSKTFTRAYYLMVHSVIHDPTLRPFKCNEPGCEASFRAPMEFQKHASQHPGKPERMFRCKICREVKKNSSELHTHIRQFHLDKMHACQHEGCTFIGPTLSRVKRHAEGHQDKGERVRPYKCTLCECSYIRGDNLQQHMDTAHNGASSAAKNPDASTFPCHICSKHFEFDWKLKSHLRKTHGKKRRKSNYIPKRTQKQLFFYCEDCDWSLADAAALRRHMKTKHKGDPIPCLKQPCDKKYYYVNKLEIHMKTQHENLTREDELKLNELKQVYPAEGVEEIEEKTTRRKSQGIRKGRTPKKTARRPVVEDEDDEDDEEGIDFEESEPEVKVVARKSRRQVSRVRNLRKMKKRMTQESFEPSDEEDQNL